MTITILVGDVIDKLRELPDQSVHCCVTSPPYWGLRDYGVDGQIGLEKTPEEYVAKMVEVFREVKRVLRDDGTLWLNLGDSYATAPAGNFGKDMPKPGDGGAYRENKPKMDWGKCGLKQKDLYGIPWRVAFALQADGWYLRSDIIWSKPNPMPESVTDRPTKAHEYVFLLSKKAKYYYDADAVREKSLDPESHEGRRARNPPKMIEYDFEHCNHKRDRTGDIYPNRNRRTVWEIATQPTPDAHFATFPEALVEPCIKAGTSERGCCTVCGSPWERVVEKGENTGTNGKQDNSVTTLRHDGLKHSGRIGETPSITTGWQPTCTCTNPDTIPCTVLDPFGGSGTTGLVARNLKRDAILIELNPEYVKIMKKKLRLNELLGVA